ncbi:hypothetical protein F4677DRAFT_459903 [Hypoxylon crocopeplum]|nr:hypothetical protein F4677DRAFT_459903 [Hypoxylon crocopeplum]
MSFARLPTEVTRNIITAAINVSSKDTNLPPYPLARLACVNAVFQQIVEEANFEEIELESEEILPALVTLSRVKSRFGYVRRIFFVIRTPEYDEEPYKPIEDTEKVPQVMNNGYFTLATYFLFDFLSHWGMTTSHQKVDLHLLIKGPLPYHGIEGLQIPVHDQNCPLHELKAWTSSLNLACSEHRPPAAFPFIKSFAHWHRNSLHLSPQSLGRIAFRFQKLESLEWSFWDCQRYDLDLRRFNRQALATSLLQLPASVEKLGIHSMYLPPTDHDSPLPVITGPGLEDPATGALRRASQNLRHLDASGVLGSPELFWPERLSSANKPAWPKMETLVITYHILNPHGEWLFEGDEEYESASEEYEDDEDDEEDEEDEEDESLLEEDHDGEGLSEDDDVEYPRMQYNHLDWPMCMEYIHDDDLHPEDGKAKQFRYSANEKLMNDFYRAAGKALACMPKLKLMKLDALVFWNGRPLQFHAFKLSVVGRRAVATWTGSPAFRPSQEVLNVWMKSADKLDLTIRFEYAERELIPPPSKARFYAPQIEELSR